MSEPALDPNNIAYLESLYDLWQGDQTLVAPEWAPYFTALAKNGALPAAPAGAPAPAATSAISFADKQGYVEDLLYAFRDVGYLYADLNPLRGYITPGIKALRDSLGVDYALLDLQDFNLDDADLNQVFQGSRWMTPLRAPLREIVARMREVYCSAMGVEYLHIQNKVMRDWIMEELEHNDNRPQWPPTAKRAIQEDLIRAEEFERFIHTRFVGQKRFSLEGSEALLPALHYAIDQAAYASGVEEIVLAMAHRGRLNVLANLLDKPLSSIFATFDSGEGRFQFTGSGDVRYHMGYSADHINPDGSSVHISLGANPSHLEAVDAVAEGKARGKQHRRGDTERKKVIPIIIHGDAAFAGQGVVAEVFNLSQLKGYRTGGTIHIIVNNQIGFTTAAVDTRSFLFPTDIAKAMPVPIFHVNGDRPEYVVRAMDIAIRFRQKFGYDAVVDIFCYRKYGHNESDDPTFTHPVMYEMIRELPSVTTQYGEQLHTERVFTHSEQAKFRKDYVESLSKALDAARDGSPIEEEEPFRNVDWQNFVQEYDHSPVETAIAEKLFNLIAANSTRVPAGMRINPKLERLVEARRKQYDDGTEIDWASGEALAFGSLLLEGTPVRLSGEDSGRGTFSQRHAVWWHLNQGVPEAYVPLNNLADRQERFCVYDSPLSEYSVLGFDYGYALAQPQMLILWEAQFGDFANGAQVIIDQFVTAAEAKWKRSNGLVMLLPHGYSGQGPDHSSGHIERFLQSCAEENIQVCNLTTPAQYFHVLRRQMRRRFRKPLIIMAPKGLLRDKRAVSPLKAFTADRFHEVIDDAQAPRTARRVMLCSGQVYYDLLAKREELQDTATALLRMEQFYPFPAQQLQTVLATYAHIEDLVWAQEEPRNRGGWTFMREHLPVVTGDRPLRYAGRPASASTATGSISQHRLEVQKFLAEAFETESKGRNAV